MPELLFNNGLCFIFGWRYVQDKFEGLCKEEVKAKTMQHVKIASEHPNVVVFMKKLEDQALTEKKHG